MTGLYLALGLVALIVGALVLAYWRGSAAGARKVEREVERESRQSLERIDQARANAPTTLDDTVDRMRKGGF